MRGVVTFWIYLEAILGPRVSAETNQKVMRGVEVILESQNWILSFFQILKGDFNSFFDQLFD